MPCIADYKYLVVLPRHINKQQAQDLPAKTKDGTSIKWVVDLVELSSVLCEEVLSDSPYSRVSSFTLDQLCVPVAGAGAGTGTDTDTEVSGVIPKEWRRSLGKKLEETKLSFIVDSGNGIRSGTLFLYVTVGTFAGEVSEVELLQALEALGQTKLRLTTSAIPISVVQYVNAPSSMYSALTFRGLNSAQALISLVDLLEHPSSNIKTLTLERCSFRLQPPFQTFFDAVGNDPSLLAHPFVDLRKIMLWNSSFQCQAPYQAFFAAIINNPSLKELHLSECEFPDYDTTEKTSQTQTTDGLATAADSSQLRLVSIKECSFGSEAADLLGPSWLAKSNKIEHFKWNWSHYGMNTKYIIPSAETTAAVIQSLTPSVRMASLKVIELESPFAKLSFLDSGKNVAEALANLLEQENCAIETLVLCMVKNSSPPLAMMDITPISEALRNNQSLVKLDLSGNKALLKGVDHTLTDSLSANSTLHILDLSGTHADLSFFTSLAHTSGLRSLNISGMNLSSPSPDSSWSYLVSGLGQNSSLKTLTATGLKLDGWSLAVLFYSLLCRKRHSLEELDIANNVMRKEDVDALISFLVVDKSLTRLSIASCFESSSLPSSLASTDTDMLTMFATRLPEMTGLRRLDLSGNVISQECAAVLLEGVTRNSTLLELNLWKSRRASGGGPWKYQFPGYEEENEQIQQLLADNRMSKKSGYIGPSRLLWI